MHSTCTHKQEVWPPGLADTVCPRPPLMTQVQHFVCRIKKRQRWDVQTMWAYDLDFWPWSSPRLSVIRVLLVCQSRLPSAYIVVWPTQVRHTIWPCDLDLKPWRSWRLPLMRVYVLHPHTNFEVLRPYRSEDMARLVSALVGLWPWPLTYWRWNWCAI